MLHPARDLREASPPAELRPSPSLIVGPGTHDLHSDLARGSPPPPRKDTASSVGTSNSNASAATVTSGDPAGFSGGSPRSPSFAAFPRTMGTELSNGRRGSSRSGRDDRNSPSNRRRTGPLTPQQRDKAALMRKLGACTDCRRRRVACDPSHHGMSWEDARKKTKVGNSPSLPNSSGRLLSPALPPVNVQPQPLEEPQAMDMDPPPPPPPPPPPLRPGPVAPPPLPSIIEARNRTPLPTDRSTERLDRMVDRPLGERPPERPSDRTPLPSGRNLERLAAAALPAVDNVKADMQAAATRILTSAFRNKYSTVHALLLYWQDEDKATDVASTIQNLAGVLHSLYGYTCDIAAIPSFPEERGTPSMWVSRKVTEFFEEQRRDIMRVVYYNGHSFVDGNREMVLAISRDMEAAIKVGTIRWSTIQQCLESARSDTLVLMDAAYYPSTRLVREQGMLEFVTASTSEDHMKRIGRNTFTGFVADFLQSRSSQTFERPFSAAELHAKILERYPKRAPDASLAFDQLKSFPVPLHMQVTANARLSSILLAPLPRRQGGQGPVGAELQVGSNMPAPQINLTLRLSEDTMELDSWAEWLRAAPECVKDIRVDSVYRNTLSR